MLARLFCSPDFDQTLRRRRTLGFCLLALGILGEVCYFALVDGRDTLPDFVQGLYFGTSNGICLGAVFLLIRAQYLMSNPEARKKAKIQEQDEREQAIVNGAFQFAGYFTFFACVAALMVTAAFSETAALVLLCVLAVYAVAWVCANVYLSKKL